MDNNAEHRREYQRKYYQDHKEKAREYQRLYNKTHKRKGTERQGRANPVLVQEKKRMAFNSFDLMHLYDDRFAKVVNQICCGERIFTM